MAYIPLYVTQVDKFGAKIYKFGAWFVTYYKKALTLYPLISQKVKSDFCLYFAQKWGGKKVFFIPFINVFLYELEKARQKKYNSIVV